MDWTILGIKETKDKKEIVAAYREKLKETNPEDSPEAFMALRSAYEEALRLAEQEETPKAEGPVALWMEKVKAVYFDYKKRLDPECWKELLRDDVCVAIDKKPQAEKALLEFFMENYYIPRKIWMLLDDCFGFAERKEALYESYPKDFIDFVVIEGINFESSLPFDMFEPGENAKECDDYRRIYYRANRSSGEEFEKLLDQLESLSEQHPYGRALRCIYLTQTDRVEEGRKGYIEISEQYPEDATLGYNAASIYLDEGDPEKALAKVEAILAGEPMHYRAKRLQAQALAALERYDDAKEVVYRLYDMAAGDQRETDYLSGLLKDWNQRLIEGREKRLAETPEDGDNALELGWCYLQSNREEDALNICRQVKPGSCDEFQYHNLYAKTLYALKKYEEAIPHFKAAAEISKNTASDGTEETARRIHKQPEMLQLLGSCQYLTGKKEEGRKNYEEALKLSPDEPAIMLNMISCMLSDKDYSGAEELAKRLTVLQPSAYSGYYLLSVALYEQGRDRDAFDAINRALGNDGSELWGYIHKMRILERNGVWEEIREIIKFLRDNGVEDHSAVLWFEAELTEVLDKDPDKALELYKALAERIENGEPLEWAAMVYFNIAILMEGQKTDEDKDAKLEKISAVLDKGLEKDPLNEGCMDFKAWILKSQKEYDEALKLYKKLEENPNHKSSVDRALGDIYYQDLSRNAKLALEYYLKVPEYEEYADLMFYIGTCYRYLYDYRNAENIFKTMKEKFPDDVDGWRGLSFVYESENRAEEALAEASIVLDMKKKAGETDAQAINHKIRLERRANRPMDALRTVDELIPVKDSTPLSLKFDIMAQFGMWREAEELLKNWKSLKKEVKQQAYSELRFLVLTGELREAKIKMMLSSGLAERDRVKIKDDIANLNGDYRTLAIIRENNRKTRNNDTFSLLKLMECYSMQGKKDKAVKCAEELKPRIEADIAGDHRNEPMHRTRLANVLAVLGKFEEAKAELTVARSIPLCEDCDYCSCKDADLVEAEVLELEGDLERAAKLFNDGLDNWPDEVEFITGIKRMEKRGTGR